MAHPELDGLNVPVDNLKSRDYNKDGKAPQTRPQTVFLLKRISCCLLVTIEPVPKVFSTWDRRQMCFVEKTSQSF